MPTGCSFKCRRLSFCLLSGNGLASVAIQQTSILAEVTLLTDELADAGPTTRPNPGGESLVAPSVRDNAGFASHWPSLPELGSVFQSDMPRRRLLSLRKSPASKTLSTAHERSGLDRPSEVRKCEGPDAASNRLAAMLS